MTVQDVKLLEVVGVGEEEYSIPLDISDIINICREYNKLGWQIQNQVESILDLGVDQSIKASYVKRESLPHIKSFLRSICENPYFGDAVDQAKDCIFLLEEYEQQNKSINMYSN
jgi:hypothetical protein